MSTGLPPFASAPILLCGENRSGTTLLSVILDAHPDLVVGPELDFLAPPNLGSHIRAACELLTARDPRVLGPGTDTADPTWYDGAHFVKQCERFGLDFGVLDTLVARTMRELGRDLVTFEDRCVLLDAIGEHRREASGVRRWGVKIQRYAPRAADFARCWPRAHFVHIVRDGRDVAASHLFSVAWGHRSIQEAAESWTRIVSLPRGLDAGTPYLEVRYEDLAAEPEPTLKRILEFLDLPWHEAVLHHTDFPHALLANPWAHPAAEAIQRPVTGSRVGRHRTELTPAQVAAYEAIAGAELRRLGYL